MRPREMMPAPPRCGLAAAGIRPACRVCICFKVACYGPSPRTRNPPYAAFLYGRKVWQPVGLRVNEVRGFHPTRVYNPCEPPSPPCLRHMRWILCHFLDDSGREMRNSRVCSRNLHVEFLMSRVPCTSTNTVWPLYRVRYLVCIK